MISDLHKFPFFSYEISGRQIDGQSKSHNYDQDKD